MLLFGVASLRPLFWVLFLFEQPCAKARWKPCSITGNRYLKMLKEKILPSLLEYNPLRTVTFMQNRAPPDIKSPVMQILTSTFGEEQLISRYKIFFGLITQMA